MATPSTPEAVSRVPLELQNPSPRYPRNGDFKENSPTSPRKQVLNIPLPVTSPVQSEPKSPVKINVRSEDWPPHALSGVIEDSEGRYEEGPLDQQRYRSENDDRSEPITPVPATHDMPDRPSYNSQGKEPVQQPQPGFLTQGNGNRTPSGSSLSNLQSPNRGSTSYIDENGIREEEQIPDVPRFHYHHQATLSESGLDRIRTPGQNVNRGSNMVEAGQSVGRHLTPTLQMARGTPIQRPHSTYSDLGSRGRSPASHLPGSPNWRGRAPSAESRGSYDNRPLSYIDLANVSYPQPSPAGISLDNSELRSAVGNNASLLSMSKTIEMYRQNVKKVNNVEAQYTFAIMLIEAAQKAGPGSENGTLPRKLSPKPGSRDADSPHSENGTPSGPELLAEAKSLLQKLADRSYPYAQYYLADGYASGLFNKGKGDYSTAFPLFVAASKHGHAESGYRAALCYEFGWGCRKDFAKAVQFLRQSASKNHPGAMTRLGRACLSGEMGPQQYREGLKWFKRATESADHQYNEAPFRLGLLYETGYGDDLFQDESYAAQLFTQAADLGNAESCYRMGDAYEHGKLTCPRDPALSVHFYTGAAQMGHPAAMMALCAWYMVGAPPVLDKDENEAYEWARKAAEAGLVKAEYAVGYFTEMGIGCRRDPLEANVWYVKAAEGGDARAKHRLAAIRAAASGGVAMDVAPPRNNVKIKKSSSGLESTEKVTKLEKKGKDDKDCIIM